jgi:hypothetical protein
MKHQADKGDEMQANDRFRQAFVILGEPPNARRPCGSRAL